MVNIKDVARKAGVSISTVSYAINNSPKVSPETRKRILKIAEEMNYNPSGLARNLKRKKTEIIGVFLDGIVGPYYNDIVFGVQETLKAMGYGLIVSIIDKKQKNYGYNLLMERWVDGAIILNASLLPQELTIKISESVPLVLIDIGPEILIQRKSKQICTFILDNFGGAYLAAEHLIGLGHSKIGYFNGLEDSFDNQQRKEGFLSALQKSGLELSPKYDLQGRFRSHLAYDVIQRLALEKDLPDAIFCANDEMAIGAIKAFDEAGIRVPEDIAIIGFDDISYASMIKPSLSTIHYDRYKMGESAVKYIFEMFRGIYQSEPIKIQTSLVIRDSCGGSALKKRMMP